MRRDRRLTRARDFAAVRLHGRSWADRFVVLVAHRNSLEVTRVGISVGRRVGNAVLRNKTKRRLREAVRLTSVQGGWDVVLIARKNASDADFQTLSRSVAALVRRAEVLGADSQRLSSLSKAE